MNGYRRVKEVMVPFQYCPSVEEDAPLKEVLAALRSGNGEEGGDWSGYHPLLVLNSKKKPVGTLSLHSLFNVLPRLSPPLKKRRFFSAEGRFLFGKKQRQEDENEGLLVKDAMSPLAGPAAIAEETVLSAALKMLASRVNSLPVLEDGQVIGIIRTIDIFQVIGELLAEN